MMYRVLDAKRESLRVGDSIVFFLGYRMFKGKVTCIRVTDDEDSIVCEVYYKLDESFVKLGWPCMPDMVESIYSKQDVRVGVVEVESIWKLS